MGIFPCITVLHDLFGFSINSSLEIGVSVEGHVDIHVSYITWGSDQDVLSSDSEQIPNQSLLKNRLLMFHQLCQKQISLIHVGRFPLEVHLLEAGIARTDNERINPVLELLRVQVPREFHLQVAYDLDQKYLSPKVPACNRWRCSEPKLALKFIR